MKNAYLYCHPMASVIYIEANFPAGNTRMLRVPTNQIEEAGTDIQLDGNNLSICMETLGKSIKYSLYLSTSNIDSILSPPPFSREILSLFCKKIFLDKMEVDSKWSNIACGKVQTVFFKKINDSNWNFKIRSWTRKENASRD